MALMVLLGLGGLWWMLAVGAVVAAEACVPRGERLRVPLGVVLVGVGLLVLATGAAPGA
jgi:predicted metal-binding membrane protein